MTDGMMGVEIYRDLWVWREVLLWLLVFELGLLTAGQRMERELRGYIYGKAMRFGSWRKWWRHCCICQIRFSLGYTLFLYGLMWIFPSRFPLIQRSAAVGLLGMNLCMSNLIQSWLIFRTQQIRLTIGIMTVYLLMILILPSGIAAWYPGSWGMWKRSEFFLSGGFSGRTVVLIEIIVIVGIVLCGCTKNYGRRFQ